MRDVHRPPYRPTSSGVWSKAPWRPRRPRSACVDWGKHWPGASLTRLRLTERRAFCVLGPALARRKRRRGVESHAPAPTAWLRHQVRHRLDSRRRTADATRLQSPNDGLKRIVLAEHAVEARQPHHRAVLAIVGKPNSRVRSQIHGRYNAPWMKSSNGSWPTRWRGRLTTSSSSSTRPRRSWDEDGPSPSLPCHSEGNGA